MDWEFPKHVYVCRGLIRDESYDGDPGFVAYCENLPGVVSQGDSVEEAKANLADAFAAAVATYLDDGLPIPWADCKELRMETEVTLLVPVSPEQKVRG